MKALTSNIMSLQFCDGQHCGGHCNRFHAPVDEEVEYVLIDVFAWRWLQEDGKQVPKNKASIFSVYVRTPTSALEAILNESGWNGFFAEPRASQGTGPHLGYRVIWLPRVSIETAQNLKRKHDIIVGLARLRDKIGLRVLEKNEDYLLKIVFPERQVVKCTIESLYELGPLPYGTSKANMTSLLSAWNWHARPLKPVRGAVGGRFWLVGTNIEPPSLHLPTDAGMITVTKTKDTQPQPSTIMPIVAAMKTREKIQQIPSRSTASSSSAGPSDPWMHRDPWSTFKPTTDAGKAHAAASTTDPPRNRLSELESRLKQEMRDQLQTAQRPDNDAAMTDHQSEIAELQAQQAQFKQWFQEAGSRVGSLEQQVQVQGAQLEQISQAVQHNTHATEQIRGELGEVKHQLRGAIRDEMQAAMSTEMGKLEALLSKRAKTHE